MGKKHRVLFSYKNDTMHFFPWAQAEGVDIVPVAQYFWYGPRSVLRLLYKLFPCERTADLIRRLRIRQALRKYDKIIFINNVSFKEVTRHPLFAKQKHKRSYYFYWDPVALFYYDEADLQTLRGCHELYSFQQADCERYGMQFNTQLYMPPPAHMLTPCEIHNDVCFLGSARDRLGELRGLYSLLRAQGLRCDFHIFHTTSYSNQEGLLPEEESEGFRVTQEYVPYIDYLNRWVLCSRAIVDLYQDGQTGFSLRPMEHIFFGKKLITNNRVIRQANFYHPSNIFLLGEDDTKNLRAWLDLPFEPIPDEIRDYYTIERWVERFT